MDFQTMIQAVKDVVGDQDQVQFTDTIIKRNLNWSQLHIAGLLEPTYATQTASSLDSTHLAGGVTLSGRYVRPVAVLWGGKPLFQVAPSTVYVEGQQVTPVSEDPVGYFVTPYFAASVSLAYRRMEFYPPQTPGRTGLSIVIQHLVYPAELVNNTDVSSLPELAHELIVMGAVARCKLQENDYAGYKLVMKSEVEEKIDSIISAQDPSSNSEYGAVRDAGVLDDFDTGIRWS